MTNLEKTVYSIKLEQKMSIAIREKINVLREKYIETRVIDEILNAEIKGMIQMLVLVTGRKYLYTLKGIGLYEL